MKNIVLVGLSGSGKTTLGQKLARRLHRPFVDLDHLVEEQTGLPVPKIFAGYGEAFFRELEAAAVRQAAGQQGLVIATGGGAVLREESARLLRQSGFVIYLKRPVADIAGDIEVSGRPLLREGAEKLYAMARAREERYHSCAHLVLHNTGTREEALEKLVSACTPLLHSGYAVIGHPIGHSLSPLIYKTAFAALGVPQAYVALPIPRGTLPEFAAGVRASGLGGFNVTIPHKRDIIPLLDTVEEEAAQCGAVNTVVHRDGQLCGYNTDMEGLHLALKRAGHGYQNRRVLLLGAGGAARAVALKAARAGAAHLCILARDPNAAKALAQQVQNAVDKTKPAIAWGNMHTETLAKEAALCNLLINSTPLGMQGFGADFEDLSFLKHMPKNGLVYDLVYSPPTTKFLAAAQALGLQAQNGLGMLICQALLAMELYLGKTLDKDSLYHSIAEKLTQNKEDTAV